MSLPDNFASEIIHPKNPIQNIHPDICVGVPVAMKEYTPGRLEEAVYFRNPLFEPRDIMINAARPAVLKTADFPRVSPDNLVVAVTEKRRVKVDKVNAVRVHLFKDFEVVAEDEFIDGHKILLDEWSSTKYEIPTKSSSFFKFMIIPE
jgi:hypothetical protein